MSLNTDKNKINNEETLNPMIKENKKNSTCKFEIKNRVSAIEYNQIEKCLNENKIDLKDFKNELSNKKILHKPNDYPTYPYNSEDPEDFYANMYNYLLQRKNNPFSSNYPKYIYQNLDPMEIETKKRAFRKKAENFEIDKFVFLCYKLPDIEEDNSFLSKKDSESESIKILEKDVNKEKRKKNIKRI